LVRSSNSKGGRLLLAINYFLNHCQYAAVPSWLGSCTMIGALNRGDWVIRTVSGI
jgi:hypothetical protein